MAEAFVKTIKRDYARVAVQPDAASVLRQLDFWFEHYNTVHPHKALGYRSPREFRKQLVDKTTENAVGARRRRNERTNVHGGDRVRAASRAQRGGAQRQPYASAPWTTRNNHSLSGDTGATTTPVFMFPFPGKESESAGNGAEGMPLDA